MNNNLKFISFASIALFSFPSLSAAFFYSFNASPSSIGTISISLNDEAGDACWTNLREVREYAEEKLTSKGYNLIPENGNYDFIISLVAYRQGSMCVGSYGIQIISNSMKDNVFGFHEIGDLGGVATQTDFNRKMIEAVQRMTDEM